MPPRTDYPNHLKLYRYGLCRIAYREGSRNGRRHVGTRRAENNTRQRHNDTYLPERRISRVPQRSYQPYRSDPAPAGQCRTGTQDRKEPSEGVARHALRKLGPRIPAAGCKRPSERKTLCRQSCIWTRKHHIYTRPSCRSHGANAERPSWSGRRTPKAEREPIALRKTARVYVPTM